MNERFSVLLGEYLDHDLSPTQAAELLNIVSTDHEARARFIALTRFDRVLAAEVGPIDVLPRVMKTLSTGQDTAYVESVMGAVRKISRRSARVKRRSAAPFLWWIATAAAAMILTLVGALSWREAEPVELVIAETDVQEAAPMPMMPVAETWALATTPLWINGAEKPSATRIEPDDIITSPLAEVAWRYADGTTISLAKGSEAWLSISSANGKELDLRRGSLSAQVAKQPAESPFLVRAPELVATVVGTRFSLAVEPIARIHVTEGLVQVASRDQVQLVAAGKTFTVDAPKQPTQTWFLRDHWSTSLVKGDAIFNQSQQFASIVSSLYVPKEEKKFFKPDQSICLQSAQKKNPEPLLFSLANNFSFQLRVRSEKRGKVQVTVGMPHEELDADSKLGSRRFPVDSNWSTITIQRSDFVNGTFVEQFPVRSLCIWGFAAGHIEVAELNLVQ